VNTPLVLVRRMAPANWNILWLRELENMDLSYDLQIDDTLAQGCDVTLCIGCYRRSARQRSGRCLQEGNR
jgi:hypothetical protein